MGKAKQNYIPVEWSSANRVCSAVFNKGVNTTYVVKELNNAPVDLPSEKTRSAAIRGASESDPASKAYSEETITLSVNDTKSIDVNEIIEKSIWVFKEKTDGNPVVLTFSTEYKSAPKEKMSI